MVLAASTTHSQLYILLNRQRVRNLLIACVSIIIIVFLLASFGGTSSNVGRLFPNLRPPQSTLRDVYNATLGV
jgi:hypothetical protein